MRASRSRRRRRHSLPIGAMSGREGVLDESVGTTMMLTREKKMRTSAVRIRGADSLGFVGACVGFVVLARAVGVNALSLVSAFILAGVEPGVSAVPEMATALVAQNPRSPTLRALLATEDSWFCTFMKAQLKCVPDGGANT